MEQLIELMQKQMERQEQRYEQQLEVQKQQVEQQEANQKAQLKVILKAIGKSEPVVSTLQGATPSFMPFDSSSEFWTDYWARFCTFANAHAVSDERKAKIFLTNQSLTTNKLFSIFVPYLLYNKLLFNLASQETPSKSINKLTITEFETYMKNQFHPKRFIVRERFKCWSNTQRKPGETILELAARIRQAAATCDFSAIEDPLDEALRTHFICSIHNEAVLKALFKVKDNELTFSRAIEIAVETEDTVKVAKETVFGSKPQPVSKVNVQKLKSKSAVGTSKDLSKPKVKCYRSGNANHVATDCRFKDAICNYCKKIHGHLEKVCRKKAQQSKSFVKSIRLLEVNSIQTDTPQFLN